VNKPKRRKKSQAQSWPYIVFSDRENAWRVDARTKDGGSRRFFETKAEAEGFAQKCRIAKGNAGTSSFGNAELSKFGWTVHRAIDFEVDPGIRARD